MPFRPSKWQEEQLQRAGVSGGHGEQLELTLLLPHPLPARCAWRG